MNKYWVALFCVLTGAVAFAAGFASAIHMNPLTADRYLLNLGSVGDWVSGVGALMAVFVTLWLAYRQGIEDSESLKVHADMVAAHGYGAPILSLQLSAISNGKRPATLMSFGFKSKHTSKFLVITQFSDVSQDIPATLQYGQKAVGWLATQQLAGILRFVENDCAGKLDDLTVYGSTTLGSFDGAINKNVIEALRGLQEVERSG